MKIGVTSTKHFASMAFRIDPSLHLSEGLQVREELAKSPYELITIKDASEKVFYGNIFSRVFVKDKEHGKTYLAASDTVLANIETGRYLSNKQSNQLKYLWLQKNWILVTCSGTLGNVIYTNSTFEDKIATHDLIRIVPNDNHILRGVVYAFLAGKYGYYQITQSQFGGVVKHINDKDVRSILIPNFPDTFQKEVDDLIQESARLREEAADMLSEAERLLKTSANLRDLTPEDYDYFGPRGAGREVSCFVRKRKDITTTTFNAFNLSERIRKTRAAMTCTTRPLREVLLGGDTFSSCSVPSIEVKPEHGIMFINQKDIFDNIIKGKWVSKRNVSLDKLVEYGEVIVACDGTLGENELFCRALFANEDLQGALISTHFIRMKTNNIVSPGYLFTWLNSDYGFRFIRNCQAGTKLCHPIPTMFLDIPVPIISPDIVNEIDQLVKEAHTKRYKANENERKAIRMVEEEIEKWNK